MFTILRGEIDVLQAINKIDLLLENLKIVPVLHYKSITYVLKRDNDPFMLIRISENDIVYAKEYASCDEKIHEAAFVKIESLLKSIIRCKLYAGFKPICEN